MSASGSRLAIADMVYSCPLRLQCVGSDGITTPLIYGSSLDNRRSMENGSSSDQHESRGLFSKVDRNNQKTRRSHNDREARGIELKNSILRYLDKNLGGDESTAAVSRLLRGRDNMKTLTRKAAQLQLFDCYMQNTVESIQLRYEIFWDG